MLQETAEPIEAPGTTTTTTPPDLVDEFERVSHIDDPHAAALAVFEHLERTRRLHLLVGPLTHTLGNYRRSHVRVLEHLVVAEAEQVAATATTATRTRRAARRSRSSLPSLRQLLQKTFFNGERWCRYDEAVVEDYRASIAYLRRQVDGIETTISFRRMCAEAIEAHPGAITLADIPDDVLAAVLAHRTD